MDDELERLQARAKKGNIKNLARFNSELLDLGDRNQRRRIEEQKRKSKEGLADAIDHGLSNLNILSRKYY